MTRLVEVWKGISLGTLSVHFATSLTKPLNTFIEKPVLFLTVVDDKQKTINNLGGTLPGDSKDLE